MPLNVSACMSQEGTAKFYKEVEILQLLICL